MYSATVGREYWANSCSGCGRIQGDWFMYAEPESPFIDLEDEAEEGEE